MKKNSKLFLLFALLIALIFNPPFVFARTSRSAPAAPVNLAASNIATGSITVSWSAASNASGYYVYMASPYDGSYNKIATVYGTSYTRTGLSAGTNYWFYVAAYNHYGTSSNSVHLTASTLSTPSLSSKKVLGFTTYYYSGDVSSYNSMVNNKSSINEIATQNFTTDSNGNISGLIPSSQVSYANSNGIRTYALLQNNFDGNIAKSVLENTTNRHALENNVLNTLKTNGYKGVNVDLEGIFYYDRSYYTTFVQELYNLLSPLGYSVTLSVPAKTYDSTTNSWNGAYDYSALSKYADELVLMTYDEHYPGGTAGPVASIGWVENVIKYAVTVIPKEKITLGTAAYGYDWSANGTKAYSLNGMYNLAVANNASVKWDDTSKTPYFSYVDAAGITHSDWFENAQSLGYKLDLVNSYNLGGIAIWRLGLENSDYWTTVRTKFNIQ